MRKEKLTLEEIEKKEVKMCNKLKSENVKLHHNLLKMKVLLSGLMSSEIRFKTCSKDKGFGRPSIGSRFSGKEHSNQI